MKKAFIFTLFSLYAVFLVYAQNSSALFISPEDIRLEQDGEKGFENEGGFHLYIRKKPGINSVLLTETTKDPYGQVDNYAYRALEWNAINGDERRMLEGSVLNSRYARYSLIDSTPEPDAEFGEAFHIYIPRTITYGYEWSRHGTIKIDRWTFINIRTFALPYGDYAAEFLDNPFMFDLGTPRKIAAKTPPMPPRESETMPEPTPQITFVEPEQQIVEPVPQIVFVDKFAPEPMSEPASQIAQAESEPEPMPELEPQVIVEEPILTDSYNPVAAKEFGDISDFMIYSKGPESLVEDITRSLEKINPKDKVDVVFVIDTTGSMKDDIEMLRKEWVTALMESVSHFSDIRLGLLLYRDYGSSGYNYKTLPVKFYDFTRNVEDFFINLNSFTIRGTEGGDIPEAVYEALFSAIDFYNWRGDAQRKVILIGDAEPHPSPRGNKKYTKQYITSLAKLKNIEIDAIIVPDEKSERGR